MTSPSPTPAPPASTTGAPPPVSLFRKRLRKFRTLKRGYYSFLFLTVAYLGSFLLPLLVNPKALVVRYQGEFYFPCVSYHSASTFGQAGFREPNYRDLAQTLREKGEGDWVLLPPHPYGPNESLLELPGYPPHPPSRAHPLGTDDRARDVLARLAYGFNISITFALILTVVVYTLGISVGAILGYLGGRVDFFGLRFVEIWAAVPFLYIVMILSALITPKYYPDRHELMQPAFWLLVGILALFGWMGMTYYIRGEFLREKAKDYVAAAVAVGTSDRTIIFQHILPNALTPVVTFAPFTIVGEITALVSLDFLGLGLPPPTPSWGETLHQGLSLITSAWWLVVFPTVALFVTLILVVFIGEAIREAFDPKVYARLR